MTDRALDDADRNNSLNQMVGRSRTENTYWSLEDKLLNESESCDLDKALNIDDAATGDLYDAVEEAR